MSHTEEKEGQEKEGQETFFLKLSKGRKGTSENFDPIESHLNQDSCILIKHEKDLKKAI